MANNYLEIIGDCFPFSQAYVPGDKDPTIYADLVWITTPLTQAALDASDCAVGSLGTTPVITVPPDPGDTVIWDGSEWLASNNNRVSVVFSSAGVTKNKWLGAYGSSGTSNESPFVIPWDMTLAGITYSNGNNNTNSDIKLYTADASAGNATSLLYTWALRTARTGFDTQATTITTLGAGDKLAVYLANVAGGSTPASPVVTVYFNIIDTADNTTIEDYSGNF